MKNLTISLLFAATSMGALAQSNGSAVLPHYIFSGSDKSNTFIYLTNTTDSMLEVEVTFRTDVGAILYDDGNVIGGNIEIWNTLFEDEPTSGPGPSAILTLRGRSTSLIKLKSIAVNNSASGIATISWTSPENVTEALISHARVTRKEGTTSESSYAVQVNGGKAF
ncbi:hypothetical protein CWB99_10930 [Pseudoalteromonas rubra]|uniref:Uncharacterized protein n=1 Tax=Pseudoalteromonas rubra TaxID=43658 RepID=A0A5S3WNX3_9GAMM|nr:hypothetical protein [Pseudoalteromonas rubra]TMP28741.1 hypothetical protein CWB99_10930 [Pseudoalteromonas rubra]TMP28802.1 hypothetical protein CWC00_20775 [Pseudoalteromonas rubra]